MAGAGENYAAESSSSGAHQQQQQRAHLTTILNSSNNHSNCAAAAVAAANASSPSSTRPLILITDSNSPLTSASGRFNCSSNNNNSSHESYRGAGSQPAKQHRGSNQVSQQQAGGPEQLTGCADEQVEEIDGIKYRIVAAVTKPPPSTKRRQKAANSISHTGSSSQAQQQTAPAGNSVILEQENETSEAIDDDDLIQQQQQQQSPQQTQRHKHNAPPDAGSSVQRRLNSVRRKSSAFVSSLIQNSFLGPQSVSSHEIGQDGQQQQPRRRLSIYEMTKSPPPETSIEMYLSDRRRSSTMSGQLAQQQLEEQQSTFETNYCQRQQYFKDLNEKLINHDKKLLNVVANRGQIHRHSVDIAQLPLHLAQAKASKAKKAAAAAAAAAGATTAADTQAGKQEEQQEYEDEAAPARVAAPGDQRQPIAVATDAAAAKSRRLLHDAINQSAATEHGGGGGGGDERAGQLQPPASSTNRLMPRRSIFDKRGSTSSARAERHAAEKARIVIRKFQKLDESQLSSTPAPDVKIGQRVAYKEYYGNEFGTIRWIGRVPQICPDWTAGVEFDNAIGEGDGSLNGRRYFIAKDCFAKFLPLSAVAFVDQHVGRPEPGTMISVMSAAARPGQMISIQRVSTVHVQHCFLNAPHQIPGADILAVNTRLHCQCPNCGPCAHVIKPPRTQRLARSKKNATHMCQFSTYTCCGMESQEEAMCAYTGNKATSSLPPQVFSSDATAGLPPIGNSWIEGAGYLTNLQLQQAKSMPDEYKMGAVPEDIVSPSSKRSSRRGSGKHQKRKANNNNLGGQAANDATQYQYPQPPSTPAYSAETTPNPDLQHHQQQSESNSNNINSSSHEMSTTVVDKFMVNRANNSEFDHHQTTFFPSNNNMQNPPSYSPNPDYVNFNTNNNHQQTNSTEIASTESSHVVKKPFTTPYVEPVWCESSPPPPKMASRPKGGAAKVIYRDSIENRYLFPTDDPIDSTLEADLENLSQARYGHSSTNSRLNGSKNIFKSLRSLVSCLSAQSNHSEIMERRSENTMKFSEYGDGSTSKAMPANITSSKPMNDFLVQTNSNIIVDVEKDGLNEKQQRWRKDAQAFSNNNEEYGVRPHHHHDKPPTFGSSDKQPPHNQKTIMRHISSSSDCGFSSASLNSLNFQSYQTCSPQISAEEKRKRNQIFNNFLANLMSSTTMNEEDLCRLRRVLFEPHIDNCCLHSVINQVSLGTFSDETERILATGLKNSCMFNDRGCEQTQRPSSACYHHTTANYFSTNNTFGRNETTTRLGKKIKNGEDCSSIQEDHHHHKNVERCKIPQRSLIDGSTTSESATLSSYDSFNETAVVNDNQSLANTDAGKTKDNKSTKSEFDKSLSSTTLPKAFELKLTLSINNSEKRQKDQNQNSNELTAVCEPVDINNLLDEANGNCLNPTVNINIISGNRSEDSIEKKIIVQKEDDCQSTDSTHNNQNTDWCQRSETNCPSH